MSSEEAEKEAFKQFMIVGEFESLLKDGTMEGQGMLKERIVSSNPIVLEDITKVITRHTKNVGDYYGLAIPIRNFNKVYNAMGSNYSYSTKHALHEKWGTTATDYIENLLTDLQGGRKTKKDGITTALNKLTGGYAQAVLSVNIPVTIKQFASFPLAADVVGWSPLFKACCRLYK